MVGQNLGRLSEFFAGEWILMMLVPPKVWYLEKPIPIWENLLKNGDVPKRC
jgi:hypothetical protein